MRPKVSIVIVNLNRAALTLDCVKSILAHTERDLCEIIVVDNGSAAAETGKLAAASHQFKLIPLDRNMFFGEASNIGAEHGSGDYVLFLNNDVTVTAGWLDALLATLNTEYRAGAVGPRIVSPAGELQEAGCCIRPDGWGIQVGRRMALPRSFIEATRIADYCSAACLLMRRSVFLDLGGFDPVFEPAYFEDVDLAIRLRSIGLFTYCYAAATVRHEESTTSSRIWSEETRNRYIGANHDRLVRRWGPYLRGRLEHDLEPEPLAPIAWQPENATANGKEPIVLYSASPLIASETTRSLLRIAAAFQESREVIIAADEIHSRCRIYSLCREFGVPLTSFKVRRFSGIDQASCGPVVSFGARPDRQFFARHLAAERDGQELLALLDGPA